MRRKRGVESSTLPGACASHQLTRIDHVARNHTVPKERNIVNGAWIKKPSSTVRVSDPLKTKMQFTIS